jgi:basic amino acid/polyamine antiporter, APA family
MRNDAAKASGDLPRRFGVLTATLAVVANMIGTGVFTTTGLLVGDIGSVRTILLAWLVGGAVALAGALSYAELTACIPRNGGEYRLLTEVYHPAVGFIAGWVSLKVLLITGFIVAAIFVLPPIHLPRSGGDACTILSPQFAIGLIFVSFAYSGWNGAAYVAGEVHRPARTLPIALGIGTGIVALLYLGLNLVFLVGTPLSKLAGTVEVGHVAAANIFGKNAGSILSALIALALVSSVSAMIMVGPRVYEAMGEDYDVLRFLRVRPIGGGPVVSIGLQAGLALLLLLTVHFDALLMYIGYTLSVSAALTVFGVFVYRFRRPETPRPYRTWGYPMTPALFVAFAAWTIVYSIGQRPAGALLGLATIALALLFYLGVKGSGRRRPIERTEGIDS